MQKKGESQRILTLPSLGPGPIDVVGFGENSVDVLATVPRQPVPDEKLELLGLATLPGGQVATALVACARLGCEAHYAGVFGDDAHGEFIERALQAEGINTSDCVRARGANRSAFILVASTARTRTVLWRRDPALVWPASRSIAARISQARLLLVDATDVPGSLAAAAGARSAGVPVLLDIDHTGPGVEALLQCVDVLVAARGFPQAHTGEDSLEKAMRALHARYQPAAVVVTLGGDGAVAWDGTRQVESPGFAVPVVDPTGAGDAFRGGFMSAWIAAGPGPVSLMDLLSFGNATAALNCRSTGAQTGLPSRAEVVALLTGTGVLRSNQTSPAKGTGHQ